MPETAEEMAGENKTSRENAARRLLQPECCALVVIDIQEKLMPPIAGGHAVIHNAGLLARMAQILKIPALVTTQYAKGLGGVVPELASLLPSSQPIDKLEFGCMRNEGFCAALEKLPGDPSSRDTLLLCGVEAHICVMQTALGALNAGYTVHVASDAVGSRADWNWKTGLERMRAAGAVISSTEMIIYELLGRSGSEQFKQMLPHLKSEK